MPPALKGSQKLLALATKALILDMDYEGYVSPNGIGVISETKKIIEEIKRPLILFSLQPHAKKVFGIAKALPVLSLFKSIDEDDKYLENIQKKDTKGLKCLRER